VAAIAAAFAVQATSSVAHADPMSEAKDLFAHGRELRLAGDCGNAADLFRKAYQLFPAGLGSLRNLAECEESLAHFVSAKHAWSELLRAVHATDETKYAGWEGDADAAVARLAPKVAALAIDLDVVSPRGDRLKAANVDVLVDGEKLAPALVGTPIERDPGHHVARVTGTGVEGQPEGSVELAAGESKRVTLRVVVQGQGASAGGAPTVRAAVGPAHDEDSARTRAFGFGALGVSAASLVGAAVAFGIRQSALDTLNGQCPRHVQCDPSLQSTVDRGSSAQSAAIVLGVVSGIALASGVVMLILAPRRAHAAPVVGSGTSLAWSF
jgi:hypothetical protein